MGLGPGIGAALAGGAQGVIGAWDNQREDLREEARRKFQLTLAQEQLNMKKAAENQRARDIMNPESALGALAKHKADAANQTQQAEWAHSDEQARLDREGRLRAAQAKSGKDSSPNAQKIKYLQNRIKAQSANIENANDNAARAKAQRLHDKYAEEYRLLVGINYPAPKETDINALRHNPNDQLAFDIFGETFGAANLGIAMDLLAREKAEAAAAAGDADPEIKTDLNTNKPAPSLREIMEQEDSEKRAAKAPPKAHPLKRLETVLNQALDQMNKGYKPEPDHLRIIEKAWKDKESLTPAQRETIEKVFRSLWESKQTGNKRAFNESFMRVK